MTKQTLSKQIRLAIDSRLDSHGLLLIGGLAEELANDIASIIAERKKDKGVACPLEWMTALLKVCGANPYAASPGLRAQISDCGKALIASGATLQDLDGFAIWWRNYTRNWTVTHDYPTPRQVRDLWGKYKQQPVQSSILCPTENAMTPEQVGRSFSPRV